MGISYLFVNFNLFDIVHNLDHILINLGTLFVSIFEIISLGLIVIAGYKGIINYIKKDENTSLKLLHDFSIGLSFLLGGEILNTVIITHSLQELALVGGLIVIRVILTILIHWELTQDKKDKELAKGFGIHNDKETKI